MLANVSGVDSIRQLFGCCFLGYVGKIHLKKGCWFDGIGYVNGLHPCV